ncbi:hypothetical protein GGR56DRAFT_692084 [Xylariaceae sp. FL0804]|nr:hypothetical protein GGR56DRAFT_692084 [Xylariaceae sp. FL0804]
MVLRIDDGPGGVELPKSGYVRASASGQGPSSSSSCSAGGGIALVVAPPPPQGQPRLTRRARVTTATVFEPMTPDETPEHHFPLQTVHPRTRQPRFVNRYDSREILLVADGSCVNNGSATATPAGGCSFSYKGTTTTGGGIMATPTTTEAAAFPFSRGRGADRGGMIGLSFAGSDGAAGVVGFPLELSGPGGEALAATSNRAKLRAVVAALAFRAWQEEGWRRIVVATDLEYVVLGATRWLPAWVRRRWKTKKIRGRGRGSCKPLANRDLWEELHTVVETLARLGTEVSFWLIKPREAAGQDSALVRMTKDTAKEAATVRYDSVASEFTRLCGIMV